MKSSCLFFIALSIAHVSFSQFKNIKLAEEKSGTYPPVEPSIAINKKNPKNIVAGIVLDRAVYTNDGGTTWNETQLKSPFGVYGDPALISDHKGHIYYFHLSDPNGKGDSDEGWLDRIVCQESSDGGATWNEGASIGNNPPADQDKAWPAVHPARKFMVVTWTQFDKYGSKDPACQSNIFISKSNGGDKWSKPVQLNQNPGDCIDDDNTAEGAVPAIGSDGKIYVTWANHGNIYFDRSYDEGERWLRDDLLIGKQEAGWMQDVPGIQRSVGLPTLAIDTSPSRFKGSLYLVYADQKTKDDTDIWMIRSTDRGDYWTKPMRINKDEGHSHQFFPWIAVDDVNGNVYIVYYDRRNYDDLQTDVYLSYSTDGGNNFKEVKISETPFTPTSEKFFGDYTNISAHDGVIAPIWTRMDEGKTSVWTCIIKASDLEKIK